MHTLICAYSCAHKHRHRRRHIHTHTRARTHTPRSWSCIRGPSPKTTHTHTPHTHIRTHAPTHTRAHTRTRTQIMELYPGAIAEDKFVLKVSATLTDLDLGKMGLFGFGERTLLATSLCCDEVRMWRMPCSWNSCLCVCLGSASGPSSQRVCAAMRCGCADTL